MPTPAAPTAPAPTLSSPEGWADHARAAEQAGRWADAATAWDRASGATLGHNRADRYRACAERCRANVDPLTTYSATAPSTPTARPGRPVVTRTRR